MFGLFSLDIRFTIYNSSSFLLKVLGQKVKGKFEQFSTLYDQIS